MTADSTFIYLNYENVNKTSCLHFFLSISHFPHNQSDIIVFDFCIIMRMYLTCFFFSTFLEMIVHFMIYIKFMIPHP